VVGVACTQVPGLDALVTKPGLQTHVGTLLGPTKRQDPWPWQGPVAWSRPAGVGALFLAAHCDVDWGSPGSSWIKTAIIVRAGAGQEVGR